MTLQRFQGIVLKLSNQMFVRHYLWLNYPLDPQLMGLQFSGERDINRLKDELMELGIGFDEDRAMWTVKRTD